MKHSSNKGFSLIELVVVIAIMAVAVGASFVSFSSIYGARALKAAKTIDGIISQSKVNAMSGRKNLMAVYYDEQNQVYKVGLYAALKDSDGSYLKITDADKNSYYVYSTEPYETQDVGNKSLSVIIDTIEGQYPLKTENDNKYNGVLVIDFNADTGAVKNMIVITKAISNYRVNATKQDGTSATGYIVCTESGAHKCALAGDHAKTRESAEIIFKSYSTHTITLYRATGSHEYE